jgi:cytochrome c553
MHCKRAWLLAAVLTAAGPAVAAADLSVALKAASCNACHGPGGASIAGIPPLAGRAAEELAGALLDFKYGKRRGTVMQRHARGYSDDELRAIAAEFARQDPEREKK